MINDATCDAISNLIGGKKRKGRKKKTLFDDCEKRRRYDNEQKTNERTNKQASKQANKQTNKQTNEQFFEIARAFLRKK